MSKFAISFLIIILLFAPFSAKAVLRDNTVVLYMPLDEGNGNEVKDISQSGKIGVLGTKGKDLPKWVNGKFGKALEFDGKTNYVEV